MKLVHDDVQYANEFKLNMVGDLPAIFGNRWVIPLTWQDLPSLGCGCGCWLPRVLEESSECNESKENVEDNPVYSSILGPRYMTGK